MQDIDFLFIIANVNLRGGTEIQTLNLTQILNETGYRAIIFSITPYEGKHEWIISLNNFQYTKYVKKERSILNKLAGNYFSDSYLNEILKKELLWLHPSLVVNQTYDLINALPFGGGMKIAQVLNWSIIGYEASIKSIIRAKVFLIRYLSAWSNYICSRRRHFSIGKCDAIITLTKSAILELKVINPSVCTQSIHVISNPLKERKDAETISTLNNKNLIYVGRLSREKGVMRLLQIWRRVSAELIDYTLSIYGEGYMLAEMKNCIQEHNIERIRFCGYESDLSKIYLSADLLLSTSDSEGFGLVFVESFYYGVPVISFDCPVSPREIIGQAGVLIDCFDELKYSSEVIALMNNKQRLFELQTQAICRARDFYENRIVKQWERLLDL